MAKKKAKTKKKAAKDSKKKSGGTQTPVPPPVVNVGPAPTPPVAEPYQPPGENKFSLYEPVSDTQLAEHRRPLSLDQVRVGVAEKVKFLQAANLNCPDALYTDVENVIIWLQTAEIGQVVRNYVRLMETARYWHVFCEEQGRDTERKRKKFQRQLQEFHITQAKVTGDKSTKDAIDARVRVNDDHDMWLKYQETWEFLGKQIHQVILSMQTEMLVQSSVWTQHEIGMRGTAPGGAVGQ